MGQEPEESRKFFVYSPLKGKIKSLKEVNDPTFSEEILGKGLAILPEEGKLYAPFDGEETLLFDTKHAIRPELRRRSRAADTYRSGDCRPGGQVL